MTTTWLRAAPAPPYLEDDGSEIVWIRADLMDEAGVLAYCAESWQLDAEDAALIKVLGPLPLCPDPTDEYGERWKVCAPDDMQARYWQVDDA